MRQVDPPPPSRAPVRREGDLWEVLDTVGRVTGALLRLREEKTILPQPLPLKDGTVPTPPPVGRARKSKQKVDRKGNGQGNAQTLSVQPLRSTS